MALTAVAPPPAKPGALPPPLSAMLMAVAVEVAVIAACSMAVIRTSPLEAVASVPVSRRADMLVLTSLRAKLMPTEIALAPSSTPTLTESAVAATVAPIEAASVAPTARSPADALSVELVA